MTATTARSDRLDRFSSLLDRSAEPLGFAAGDANVTRYVGNGPTNAVDPTGLKPTKSEIDAYNQELLDYYHRVMQQLLLVGEALYCNGPAGLAEEMPWYTIPAGSTTQDSGGSGKLQTTPPKGGMANFFPTNWNDLQLAIIYSMDNYATIGWDGVTIWGNSSQNWWHWPGINISDEQFYGSVQSALEDLIHEPLHDFWQFGWFHGGICEIVPVPGSTSPEGSDALTQLIWFLQAIKLGNGNSLWQQIQQEAGPKPTPPADFTPPGGPPVRQP